MKNKYFRRFFNFSLSKSKDDRLLSLKEKVEKIAQSEDDFRSLYEYDIIEKLDEEGKKEYLKSIIKDYLYVKKELMGEKNVKQL